MSECLKIKKTLTEINLSYNNIGEYGAKYISECLQINEILIIIQLAGNNIGKSGA